MSTIIPPFEKGRVRSFEVLYVVTVDKGKDTMLPLAMIVADILSATRGCKHLARGVIEIT